MSENKEKIFIIRKIKKWTESEDELIMNYGFKGRKQKLKELTRQLHKKTSSDCYSRFKSIFYLKGRWTEEEDRLCLEAHKKHGWSWSLISREMKTRNWKQIRDRFLNYLDPNVSNKPFTLDEDILIYDLYQNYGSNWKYHSQFLSNRPADKIKNRFNSCIKGKERKILFIKLLGSEPQKTCENSVENSAFPSFSLNSKISVNTKDKTSKS